MLPNIWNFLHFKWFISSLKPWFFSYIPLVRHQHTLLFLCITPRSLVALISNLCLSLWCLCFQSIREHHRRKSANSPTLKLAKWRSGEGRRKREAQVRRIGPVLWQISLKLPVPNTLAARTLRAGTVSLMYVINAFAQVVVSKCTYPHQENTPSCPHFLNSYQVSRYQNVTLSIKINVIFSCVAWFLEITEPWAKYKINGGKSYTFLFWKCMREVCTYPAICLCFI